MIRFIIPVLLAALWLPARIAVADSPLTATRAASALYNLQSSMIPAQAQDVYRVNVPYFAGNVSYPESAIFWFGRVSPNENYTDVRVGYNNTELQVSLSIVDRLLWYDPDPVTTDLTAWDSAELLLSLSGNTGAQIQKGSYRLAGQLTWWEPDRIPWEAAYQGDGGSWTPSTFPFTTHSGWRGNEPNDGVDDRGWTLTFHIPFASLGLAGAPARGTIWGLAVAIHNRNDAAGTPIPVKSWPEGMNALQPATWGQLAFGNAADIRSYNAPPAWRVGTSVIRQGLSGAMVRDGAVGGGTNCGEGLEFWTEWGEHSYAGLDYFNVQNQEDIADWPCFSKYYATFPLPAPQGRVIISATLTLHEFGSSGQGLEPPPWPSYIQVFTVDRPWEQATLTWNNASLAGENVGGAWVDPLEAFAGWPGVPYHWDVSWATANALAQGENSLHLALYTADGQYHSGKYFTSSEAEDWNEVARPTLTITWGQPLANPSRLWLPQIWSLGQAEASEAAQAIEDCRLKIRSAPWGR